MESQKLDYINLVEPTFLEEIIKEEELAQDLIVTFIKLKCEKYMETEEFKTLISEARKERYDGAKIASASLNNSMFRDFKKYSNKSNCYYYNIREGYYRKCHWIIDVDKKSLIFYFKFNQVENICDKCLIEFGNSNCKHASLKCIIM